MDKMDVLRFTFRDTDFVISVWCHLYVLYRLTRHEANPPEARVEGHAYLCALVEWKNDALLQVEPVVGAYGNPQQAQAANSEHAAQQRQRLPAT